MRRLNASALVLAFTVMATPCLSGDTRLQPREAPAVSIDPAIREVLQQYSAAFESLDAAAVKKVQPSIDVENLKSAFKQMRSLQVSIEDIRILSTDGARTRLSCRVTQTLTPKAGSKQTMAVTRVMRLQREDGTWVIDAFER